MSDESVTISIDYGDGSEPEELVVTPGFFHFHPAVDEEKHAVTVTVVGADDDDDDDDDIEDADIVDDDDDDEEIEDEFYDPSAHTVQEVKDYVTDHPDDALDILDVEQEGQNRITLVSWLENFTTED